MNKKLKLVVFSFLLLSILILTGCSALSGFDNPNLMRPPRATGDKAQIQEIIEEKAGGDYILKYPKNGNYRSAIINYDLDHDGIDESIVFYKSAKGDKPTTHILLIKNLNGVWNDIGDYAGNSADIDCVEIGDISGNGTEDIVVGWSNEYDKNNGGNGYDQLYTMSAYLVQKNNTVELKIDDTYNQFILANITGENKKNIMLFSTAVTSPMYPYEQITDATAKMLTFDNNTQNITRSFVSMGALVNRFLNITFGKASKSQSGIFVDCSISDNTSETQFIYWDKSKSKLLNPITTQNIKDMNNNPTIRFSPNITCSDINGDGFVEIPTESTHRLLSAPDEDSTPYFQCTWNTYNPSNNKLTPIMDTITNTKFSYYFIIPQKWEHVIAQTFDDSISFYGLNDDNTYTDESLLLTIKVFTTQDWLNTKNNEYIEVHHHGKNVYAVNIPAESPKTKNLAMSLNKIPEYLKFTNK